MVRGGEGVYTFGVAVLAAYRAIGSSVLSAGILRGLAELNGD